MDVGRLDQTSGYMDEHDVPLCSSSTGPLESDLHDGGRPGMRLLSGGFGHVLLTTTQEYEAHR